MQNKKTLKKVLEELEKESPRLDYIRGMLEVLVEDEPVIISPLLESNVGRVLKTSPGVTITATNFPVDPELPPPPNFNNKVLPIEE